MGYRIYLLVMQNCKSNLELTVLFQFPIFYFEQAGQNIGTMGAINDVADRELLETRSLPIMFFSPKQLAQVYLIIVLLIHL